MFKLILARPIGVLMFILALAFFGMGALNRLSVELYPNIDVPMVTITTAYPGANAQIVESKVTDKIEEAVSGIDALKKITSISADNVSVVVAEFELEKPIEVAANDVRDKVSSVSFGSEVKSPIVEKLNIGGTTPVISLFISPKNLPKDKKELLALHTHTDLNIKPLLQRIKGVGRVNLVGFLEREIHIKPSPSTLNKYNLTFSDVANAINSQNIEIDGGKIISSDKEWKILTKADANSIKELEEILVGDRIRLGDIALIEESFKEPRSFTSLKIKANSKEEANSLGVLLEIEKITGANEIEITKAIKELMPSLEALSKDYQITLIRDTTTYIKDSLKAVQFDLILGAILAVLVVFIFLRDLRITLIAALSIPSSILGTFALMEVFGMSLNLVTMIALTLAIGIIIDDAIVVIENIYKKMEEGKERREAAYLGIKEISFALIAISCMLLSVFVPIANMSGITGRFFVSFGISLTLAIIVSYLVVISFIPSLSARVIKHTKSAFYLKSEKYFIKLEEFYIKVLNFALNYSKALLVGVFLLFVASVFLITRLGVEFLPSEDKAEFDIKLTAKPGISLEEMRKITLKVQEELLKVQEVEYSLLNIGFTSEQKVYEGKIYVRLSPYNEREKSQKEIMASLRETYKKYAKELNLEITLIEIPQISLGEDDSPLQLSLYSLQDIALEQSVQKIQDFMEKSGKYRDIHTDIKPKTPQITLKIDKALASKYHLNATQIALAISNAFSGAREVSYFRERGREYSIILLSSKKDAKEDLKHLTLKNSLGEVVFLEGLVSFEEEGALSSIKRYDRQRSVNIYANLNEGVSLGEATSLLEDNKEIWLEPMVNYKIEGYAKYMQETNSAFIVAMVSAFVLIYFILATLYESLLQPLIIMITLPLSFVGAFLALFVSGNALSLFSIMGLMLLMGLVGKNATLLIDVANLKREEGETIKEALFNAGRLRLRPILMTTIAMVFGMLPLALAQGEGSAIKSPMGIAMIGGLLFSMFLSLVFVPIFYRMLAPLDDFLKKYYR
ncbi:acriflavin resistance protein [Helicobacter valdiviensis]|uniref:Acriflavin resistance protein n=1 Tax=Helicobacter valdiviensis TaxID=1458358 RepID=A0A2W6MSZ1_9HELI|nr:efflux RND transporter permease subunit [Helicobacter valdiviensis]PZT47532.1 acriflavin resistance protein [Helicobacter valdiviensis]